MAKKGQSPPRVYRADIPQGTNGSVFWEGDELAVEEAIALRQAGNNVVVRGPDKKENLRVAQQIETAVGPWQRDKPHKNSAGPNALPHFHQVSGPDDQRDPPGHTFYEVDKSKARKKP